MKKIIPALVAVAVMSVGLTACGDDEDCEGAGLSSGVGVMSMSGGSSGGSSGGGSRGGSSGTSKSGGKSTSEGGGTSNSKPSSPKGFKADHDDDCDDD